MTTLSTAEVILLVFGTYSVFGFVACCIRGWELAVEAYDVRRRIRELQRRDVA